MSDTLTADPADWTDGADTLAYQRCDECGAVRYFRRDFCPCCGSEGGETRAASGRGTVHAITTVARAPSVELRAEAPYGIALVDAAEGFRFMAHAAEPLVIGEPVRTRFRDFAGHLVPFVEPEDGL